MLCLFVLAACVKIETAGPDAQGYKWVRDGAVGVPVIHRDQDVYLRCAMDIKAKSCAVIENNVCNVYLPPNPEPWQEAHERRHCEGWRHPDWTHGQ